jgi:hypothetical protein
MLELNSEYKPTLILVLGLDLGVTQDPEFFLAKCLIGIIQESE